MPEPTLLRHLVPDHHPYYSVPQVHRAAAAAAALPAPKPAPPRAPPQQQHARAGSGGTQKRPAPKRVYRDDSEDDDFEARPAKRLVTSGRMADTGEVIQEVRGRAFPLTLCRICKGPLHGGACRGACTPAWGWLHGAADTNYCYCLHHGRVTLADVLVRERRRVLM